MKTPVTTSTQRDAEQLNQQAATAPQQFVKQFGIELQELQQQTEQGAAGNLLQVNYETKS
jgi:methylphosphotriester-DNA--protein-cysteine methyltransferase